MNKDFNAIEPEKDIILYCDDFMGEYSVAGRIILRPNQRGKVIRKFCVYNENRKKWDSDFENWQNRTAWKYSHD